LFLNVISVLSLAELGIGAAICYSMYKPVAEGDINKLKSLNALYRKIYAWIALVILVIGVAIMPFLPLIISGGTTGVPVNVYAVYSVFLFSTLISYFVAHRHSLLLVHQRSDIQSKIGIVQLLLFSGLQIAVLILARNYYFYLIFMPVTALFQCLVILFATKKLYPQISGKAEKVDKETKKTITKNVVALSLHSLGGVVVFSTTNIMISAFLGLAVLGEASNYLLIVTMIISIITLLVGATRGSVGNMVASENREKNYEMYKTINFGISIIVGICSICMLCLFQPFITFWLGGDWLLPFVVMLSLVLRFYISNMRSVTLVYRDCAGLMWNDRWKPLVEIVVNIALSLLFIHLFGLVGIFLGTIASSLLVPFWVEPYVVYKNYFKKSVWTYFTRFALFTVVTVATGFGVYLLCELLPYRFLFLPVRLAIACSVTGFVYLVCFGATKESKTIISMFMRTIFGSKKKASEVAEPVPNTSIDAAL